MSSEFATRAAPEEASPSFFDAPMAWLERRPHYRLARRLFQRHEQIGASLFFLGGVTWDALTLRRIDALVDNAILGLYLVLLGGFVALAALARTDRPLPSSLRKLSTWSNGAIQFFAGGLFSAYVIYYTQSASLSAASLFLLVLVAVLVGNELVWSRAGSIYLLVGVYFLAVFCYLTFFLPVLLGEMGFQIFLASGLISAAVVIGLVVALAAYGVFVTWRSFGGVVALVLGLLGAMVVFYVNHWIPPVPLALRMGGAYHDVTRENGAFVLRYQDTGQRWSWDQGGADPFRYAPGDTVHCFAAVFAPTELTAKVYHRWQHYDPAREAWVTTDRIGYRVVGGRRGGYRGVTFKRHVEPGSWRVTVETAGRRPIGRIRFEVVRADTSRDRRYVTRRYE